MKNLFAFLLLNGVFFASSAIAAVIVWFAGKALIELAPDQAGNPWVWYAIGIVSLAAAIWFIVVVVKTAQGAQSW